MDDYNNDSKESSRIEEELEQVYEHTPHTLKYLVLILIDDEMQKRRRKKRRRRRKERKKEEK